MTTGAEKLKRERHSRSHIPFLILLGGQKCKLIHAVISSSWAYPLLQHVLYFKSDDAGALLLNLSTPDILCPTIIIHYSGTAPCIVIYPPTRSTHQIPVTYPSPIVTTQNIFRYCQTSPGGSGRGLGRGKLPLVKSRCSQALVLSYTLETHEESSKILISSLTLKDSDLIHSGWGLGIWISESQEMLPGSQVQESVPQSTSMTPTKSPNQCHATSKYLLFPQIRVVLILVPESTWRQ